MAPSITWKNARSAPNSDSLRQQIARVDALLAESQSIEMFLKGTRRQACRRFDSRPSNSTKGYGEYCEEQGWETLELKKLQRELPNKMFRLFGTHLVNGVEDPNSGKRVRGYRGVAIDDGPNDDPRQYADVPPECAKECSREYRTTVSEHTSTRYRHASPAREATFTSTRSRASSLMVGRYPRKRPWNGCASLTNAANRLGMNTDSLTKREPRQTPLTKIPEVTSWAAHRSSSRRQCRTENATKRQLASGKVQQMQRIQRIFPNYRNITPVVLHCILTHSKEEPGLYRNRLKSDVVAVADCGGLLRMQRQKMKSGAENRSGSSSGKS